MSKIHGMVYIGIGIFITLTSWKINYNALILFFYFGILFVLIGISKIIYRLYKVEEDNKPINRTAHHLGHHQIHNHSPLQNSQNHQYKKCHRCGSLIKFADRFCSRCGTKLYANLLF